MKRSVCWVFKGCYARRGENRALHPAKTHGGTLEEARRTIASAKALKFDPERAAFTWEMNSLEHIAESLAFWVSRLTAMTCPECGVKRTLELRVLPYGIEIVCHRNETDKCAYVQEVHFMEQQ